MEKNLALLDAKLAKLSPVVPDAIRSAIGGFVKQAAPFELAGINPIALAKRQKLPRIQTVKAFLHLTREGVFDLNWATHCPHCKGLSQQADSLSGLKHEAQCSLCEEAYDAGFDANVEVQFKLNPAIGQLGELDPYQVALTSFETEPGISLNLEPGEDHYLECAVQPGNYSLISDDFVVNIPVSPEPATGLQEQTITVDPTTPNIQILRLNAGRLGLRVRNTTTKNLSANYVRLKNPDWTDASLVASLQEFRDMFSKEMISQDETFGIQRLSIIFTDIKASTEMYERLGDSKAYFLVKEHFKIMEEVVRRYNGGIVKTIGDAIMAVFTIPTDALAAAHDMIQGFDRFNTDRQLDNQIIIKVGIHTGSCIAVTLNERLDYFGTTINTAARIQGLSDGRDIMVSEAFFTDSGAAAFVAEKGLKHERFVTSLKGLKENQTVYKLY